MDDRSFRCARHVLAENHRARQAAVCVLERDWAAFGKLMYDSHESLRTDYGVSCKELDLVVDIAHSIDEAGGVFGARMTGGGFGGCAIVLIKNDAKEELEAQIAQAYQRRTGITPMLFVSRLLLNDRPHRRFNALTGEWVFVSPHRTERPWQGKIEVLTSAVTPSYDSDCYLCPGNARARGERNPDYTSTYVFDNDFPAFLEEKARDEKDNFDDVGALDTAPLLQSRLHFGTCRVVCYSPRHDLTLAQMPVSGIRSVIDTWTQQAVELGARWKWVQIFENKGELMGCSNPHPHGQIWAGDFVPTSVSRELTQETEWLRLRGSPLLVEYATLERHQGARIVVEDEYWLAVVPWWAVWPFEVLLMPRRAVGELSQLTTNERDSLAILLKRLLTAYDRLFDCSFPYSFGWHSAPSGHLHDHQLHAHFYPPLLRSASVRKFMVGYELLAEPQRDLTPEEGAKQLRDCAE
jgi:UDPglucose--hexose-1-phosphate uridylyltransferase